MFIICEIFAKNGKIFLKYVRIIRTFGKFEFLNIHNAHQKNIFSQQNEKYKIYVKDFGILEK